MNKHLPLLLTLLCACEMVVTPPPEAFQILDITPREQVTNESKTVTVKLDVEPRFHVDHGTKQVRMLEAPVLEIDSQTVPLDTYLGHGQFQGTVGPGLPVGRHAIRVKLGEGREATLPDVYYEVKEPEPIRSYWIDTIGDQTVNQRFTIVINAVDSLFDGRVTVSLYESGLPTGFSTQTDRFSAGSVSQELTITKPGDNYLVYVQDDQNNSATSNAFKVLSKN